MIKTFEEFVKLYESEHHLDYNDWKENIEAFIQEKSVGSHTLNCFIDFSGSVIKDTVFHFLTEVINLCKSYDYNTVKVYGFGYRLSKPYELNIDSFEKEIRIAVFKIYDFIASQKLGIDTEDFVSIAKEINKIKREDENSTFLIFGDGNWRDPECGVQCLNTEIDNKMYLDDVCIFAYYTGYDPRFEEWMSTLTDTVGFKNVITANVKELS